MAASLRADAGLGCVRHVQLKVGQAARDEPPSTGRPESLRRSRPSCTSPKRHQTRPQRCFAVERCFLKVPGIVIVAAFVSL